MDHVETPQETPHEAAQPAPKPPLITHWRLSFSLWCLAFALLTVLWFVVAAQGTKYGLWPWQVGLLQLTLDYGFKLAGLATALSLVSLVLALARFPRFQPTLVSLAALLVAALSMFRLAGFGMNALALPPIHDVQTDWQMPVRFSAELLAARAAEGKSSPVLDAPRIGNEANARWPGLGGRLVSEVQAEAESTKKGKSTLYPALAPLYFNQSRDSLAPLVEGLIKARGWEILKAAKAPSDPQADVQIEAVVTSPWFGFKDDVAIRLRPMGKVTRVDMRSVSRVGLSDLGANARRVSQFMYELQDRGRGRRIP